jgi:hypothetical protein
LNKAELEFSLRLEKKEKRNRECERGEEKKKQPFLGYCFSVGNNWLEFKPSGVRKSRGIQQHCQRRRSVKEREKKETEIDI